MKIYTEPNRAMAGCQGMFEVQASFSKALPA
jgi:hypothetical protein